MLCSLYQENEGSPLCGGWCLFCVWHKLGINADLTISRLLADSPGARLHTTTILLCKDAARVQLREHILTPRSECHCRAYAQSSIIDDVSPLCPLPTPSKGCPPLPTCRLFRPLFLTSWFLHQHDCQQQANQDRWVLRLYASRFIFSSPTSSTFRSKEHLPH